MTDFTGGAWRSLVDGSVVSAIPDFLLTQYQFEDDSNNEVAVDSVGDNDADIVGPTYDADAAKGSFGLSHDGTDDYIASQSTINLASAGTSDQAGVGGFLKSDASGDDAAGAINWGSSNESYLSVEERSGTIQVTISTPSGATVLDSGVSVDIDNYQHVWANVDDTDIWIVVDGTEQDRTTHGVDPTDIGTGTVGTGRTAAGSSSLAFGGLVDNASYATRTLSESEVQELIDQ